MKSVPAIGLAVCIIVQAVLAIPISGWLEPKYIAPTTTSTATPRLDRFPPIVKRQGLGGLLGIGTEDDPVDNTPADSTPAPSRKPNIPLNGGSGLLEPPLKNKTVTSILPTSSTTDSSMFHSTTGPMPATSVTTNASISSSTGSPPSHTPGANNDLRTDPADLSQWKVIGVAVICIFVVAIVILVIFFYDRWTTFLRDTFCGGKRRASGVEAFVPDWEKRSWEVRLGSDNSRYPTAAIAIASSDSLGKPDVLETEYVQDDYDPRHPFAQRPSPMPLYTNFLAPDGTLNRQPSLQRQQSSSRQPSQSTRQTQRQSLPLREKSVSRRQSNVPQRQLSLPHRQSRDDDEAELPF